MNKTTASSLPHELVLEILSRLPAKSIARFRAVSKKWLTSTAHPSFLRAQLRRAPPAIVFQKPSNIRVVFPTRTSPSEWNLFLFNGDPGSTPAKRGVDYAAVPDARLETCLRLRWSCDDLLFFRNCDWDPGCLNSHYVFSLVTKEWTSMDIVNQLGGYIVGFYSHRSTREYRFLRALDSGPELNGFEVSTLGSNTWRRIRNPSQAHLNLLVRCFSDGPVTVQGCLHWVTYSNDSNFPSTVHTQLEGSSSEELSIMVFDTDTEEFHNTPLPGNRPWRFNHLFDMEGRLGLCQVTAANRMIVWESSTGNWVKRAVISTTSFNHSPEKNLRILSCNIRLLKPVAVWKEDELLLHFSNNPYIFNLKSKTLQRLETNLRSKCFCFVHKESLAFYDAFRTEHARPWNESYYVDNYIF